MLLLPNGLRIRGLRLLGLAALVASMTCVAIAAPKSDGSAPSGRTIVRWNQNNLALLTTLDSGAPAGLQLNRELAMVHIAMHDAANAVDERYERYVLEVEDQRADAALSAAAAAHSMLVRLRPGKAAQADMFLEHDLARVSDPQVRQRSLDLGAAAATAILAKRANDGFFETVPFTFGPPEPGVWQPVPPSGTTIVGTQLPFVTPFGLSSGSQFRSPPPPKLSSRRWLNDYNETKVLGRFDSTVRTADQTNATLFWREQTQFTWNTVARTVASRHDKGLFATARAFALLNIGLMDGLIAVFDTKYHYTHWRPYTAIREIDDGRADTVMDPTWQPLIPTPGHPEYNSAQAGSAAAAAFALNEIYGEKVGFTITTSTADPPGSTRSYSSFDHAVAEGADSRIWAGIHFRSATGTAAQRQGTSVGRFLFKRLLTKCHGSVRSESKTLPTDGCGRG
jgi:hypothetical protein